MRNPNGDSIEDVEAMKDAIQDKEAAELCRCPCENCGESVEVESWEKTAAIHHGYLITCEKPRCHTYGMFRMGWAQQLGHPERL